jgi:hypothetical protein
VPAMTESPFAWLGALPRPGERVPLSRSALPDPPRSYGLMRQTSSLWHPLLSLWAPVFAGCCETLLAGGPSRRYLRKSFPRCLVPYPGASPGAPTRYFPGDIGLYQLGNGSATRTHAVRRLLYGGPSRGCRHSLMFRPLGLLATQVAPTAGPHRDSGQPWLLRPSISRFVTLPCLGYASRPNRAIDGVGTHTPLDLRPCRPLPQARSQVQTGLLPRLQPHLVGALHRDAVEVFARAARRPGQAGHSLHDRVQSLCQMGR